MKTKTHLSHFLPLLALPAALFIPEVGLIFSPYVSWILGTLLFFSFLGLDPSKLIRSLRRPLEPFYMSVVILAVTPLVAIPIMGHFFPDYQLGALLFLSAPSAISAPAIAGIYGGSIAFSAINTILSSLLSPFSTPAILTLFADTAIKVDFIKMTIQLVTLIFIPFILSLTFSHYAEKTTEKIKTYHKIIPLGLLFLLFLAILSPHRADLLAYAFNKELWLAVLLAHVILLFFAKLMTVNVEAKKRQVSIQSNLLFLNVGVSLILAKTYFGTPEILFVVFCQIFWVVMVSLFRYIK